MDVHLDARVAALAQGQHGVAARRQLLELGAGRGAIEHRLSCGRLHLVHRGVYAVGHPVLSRRGEWMAAVLAAGPGARLSHRSGAALWGVRPPGWPRAEVTVPGRRAIGPGVVVHRAVLPDDEVTVRDGIPVTTVPRTLFDLAAVVPRHIAERAMTEAEVQRLTDRLSLPDLLERHPGRRGSATVRAILRERAVGANVTKSDLEAAFLAFLDEHDLPRPQTNVVVRAAGRRFEPDCVWPAHKLVVELDSRRVHHTAMAFEGDRAKDRALVRDAWRVIRVTARQLEREAAALAADLRALLATPRAA